MGGQQLKQCFRVCWHILNMVKITYMWAAKFWGVFQTCFRDLRLYPSESLCWLLGPASLFFDLFCSLTSAAFLNMLTSRINLNNNNNERNGPISPVHSSPLSAFTWKYPASDVSLAPLNLQIPFCITLGCVSGLACDLYLRSLFSVMEVAQNIISWLISLLLLFPFLIQLRA